jgi:hypothetical protein
MPIVGAEGQYGWVFGPLGYPEDYQYPWLVSRKNQAESSNRQDHNLCENCNLLDFHVLFRAVLGDISFKLEQNEAYLTLGIRLGTLNEIEGNARCSFCRLVWQCFLSNAKESVSPSQLDLVDFWLDNFMTSNDGWINMRHDTQRSGPAVVQLEVSIRQRSLQYAGSTSLERTLASFKIQELPGPEHPLGSSWPLGIRHDERTEFWRLLKWLDSCEACNQRSSLIKDEISLTDIHEKLELFSRVIDTRRLRIAYAPKGCRYVALSYVWGGQNFLRLTASNVKNFERDGSIDIENFPRSISDAISLCRELGERYLWVDSMCIIQDTQDKHWQMKSMEAIYRGAVLTIVAAAGNNANVGLPGFSGAPFGFKQLSVSVQGLKLANVSPEFKKSVDLSIWNTRAWTYQERLLSRRMLIFTKDYIYFQCNHGRAQGDRVLDLHDPAYIEHLKSNGAKHGETYKLEMSRKVNFTSYAKVVQEYMNRDLSYASDIENAFGGIKKILNLLFNGSEVLCGIPISSITIALLWSSKGNLTRRSDIIAGDKAEFSRLKLKTQRNFMIRQFGSATSRSPVKQFPKNSAASEEDNVFPSWSWVGWIGPVEFSDIKNLSERTISMVTWLDPLNKLKELPQESFGPPGDDWEGRERWLRQLSRDDQVYYTQRGSDGQHWFCHPMEPFIHDPIPIDRETGTLHLQGKVAEFSMQISSRDKGVLFVCDKQGARAGAITMDEGIPEFVTQECTLIRLSQTTLKEGNDDPAWDLGRAGYFGKPGEPSKNFSSTVISGAEKLFDTKIYNPRICWCMYNVLVVEFDGSKARRIGIGKVHIHAFDVASSGTKVIELI